MYPRKIYPLIKQDLSKKHITVITGMRRVGKTTLVKYLLEEIDSTNKIYLDLERLDNRELFLEKNYDNVIYILKQRGLIFDKIAYIVIDEIQLAKNISSVLKYLYDNYKIKFIVTGSSSFYVKNLFTESLAGRKKIFELFPLDFGEFLTFKKIFFQHSVKFLPVSFNNSEYERLKMYYNEYLEYGGFPEVALVKNINDKKDLLNDIINSYINIDIVSLSDFRNHEKIYALMKMLAARVGSRLDYAKMSRLVGSSMETIKNYINFFEKTYIIFRVPVFTNKTDREIIKAKKLYFCDNGLLAILSDISSGAKFENALFLQLKHLGNIQYYSLKTGREIDFIFNKKIALESKETPTLTDKGDLENLAKLAGIKDARLIGRHPSPKFNDYIWGGEIR